MITKKFIEIVHHCFDELNYHVVSSVKREDFEFAASNTITKCRIYNDISLAIEMFKFCTINWKKIEKIFKKEKKLALFNQIKYIGNVDIDIVDKKIDHRKCYITNYIHGGRKKVAIIERDINGIVKYKTIDSLNLSATKYKFNNNYSLYFDLGGAFSLALKKDKEKLCNFKYNKKTRTIQFNKNNTSYQINEKESGIDIIDINNNENNAKDEKNIIASLKINDIGKLGYGVVELDIYNPNTNIDIMELFGAAYVILFERVNNFAEDVFRAIGYQTR